ncbi:CrcB family protein [Microbacterium sp.]|uniref:fluoride efflux transporter FluC n=1 Tax=Microbacterium sp. TaxID=51671 RepID=UPI0028126509|nr:CrcB family protein [Microbacterium sp.]
MNLRRVLLVALGGTIGSAARLGIGLALPDDGFPVAVFVANIIGALLIGILTAGLPQAAELRIFLGTGILGGFTTYSALATGTVALWNHAPALAVGYGIVSLALGLTAAAVGLRLGRRRHDHEVRG